MGASQSGTEQTLPREAMGSTAVQASEPCSDSQEAGSVVSSATLLARGLSVVIPPPSLLIPGPVFACLAAKDKLQALRKLLFRYPNRALPKREEQCGSGTGFPFVFFLLSSF